MSSGVGRPTKYSDDMPNKLLSYFSEIATFTVMGKEFPRINTKEGFCSQENIATSTFDLWVKTHDAFSGAWAKSKAKQAEFIVNLTANRIIDPNYGKMLTVNVTSYRDKVEHDHKNTDIKVVLSDDRATQL